MSLLIENRLSADLGDGGRPIDEAQWRTSIHPNQRDELLGEKLMPRGIPQYIGPGDVNEAVEYVAFAYYAWRQSSGALPWLRKRSQT